jgi:hypothetical protein
MVLHEGALASWAAAEVAMMAHMHPRVMAVAEVTIGHLDTPVSTETPSDDLAACLSGAGVLSLAALLDTIRVTG